MHTDHFPFDADLGRPINTYNHQGVAKRGFSAADRRAHAIVHMSNATPRKSSEEPPFQKEPISVVPAAQNQKLHWLSRINFGRVHTVEYNKKVMDVGKVSNASMANFQAYYRNELVEN